MTRMASFRRVLAAATIGLTGLLAVAPAQAESFGLCRFNFLEKCLADGGSEVACRAAAESVCTLIVNMPEDDEGPAVRRFRSPGHYGVHRNRTLRGFRAGRRHAGHRRGIRRFRRFRMRPARNRWRRATIRRFRPRMSFGRRY